MDKYELMNHLEDRYGDFPIEARLQMLEAFDELKDYISHLSSYNDVTMDNIDFAVRRAFRDGLEVKSPEILRKALCGKRNFSNVILVFCLERLENAPFSQLEYQFDEIQSHIEGFTDSSRNDRSGKVKTARKLLPKN